MCKNRLNNLIFDLQQPHNKKDEEVIFFKEKAKAHAELSGSTLKDELQLWMRRSGEAEAGLDECLRSNLAFKIKEFRDFKNENKTFLLHEVIRTTRFSFQGQREHASGLLLCLIDMTCRDCFPYSLITSY